ncbi:MAG: LD-carboxypeptidase [Lentimicrobiaceae bacterium]|nr:LD-carboxypeptidase [Lentimicrobiaceae bacterium]
MITPSSLSSGSKIALVAPARKVAEDDIAFAVEYIRQRGFVPIYDERLFLSYNQFAGNDEQRASVLQHYLDADDIDAIMCVRGGYGTVRIIDRLDFDKFLQKPKWIVGYSDVTVLHAKMQSLGIESLHATMPINFQDNSKQALDTLFDALCGKEIKYDLPQQTLDILSKMKGEVVGGNISVLYSLLGSDIFPDVEGKVLFLEDLDEYLYHIDRMMMAFQRAGIFDKIGGLIIGGLTKMHDNAIPFGMTAEEIISEKTKDKNIPTVFNFPAGHINDNRAIILGRRVGN